MATTDGRTRTRAAFTKYYDSKKRAAVNKAKANPNKRYQPGKNEYEIRERHLRHLQWRLEEDGTTHIGMMSQEQLDIAFEDCVDSIVPRIEDTPSPNTIRNVVTSFTNFVRWQVSHGAIPTSMQGVLLENMPRIKSYKRRMLIIPGEEWPQIFTYAGKRHIMDRVLIELAFYLAMRLSETLSVRWRDFSDDFSTVTFFRDKKHDALTLKVPVEMQDSLREVWAWIESTGVEVDKNWPIVLARQPSQHGAGAVVDPSWPVQPGKPMDAQTARRALREALLAFGYTAMQMICQGMHIARRSRACFLFKRKYDIRVIARILGHDNYLTTLDYIRDGLDDEEMGRAMDEPLSPSTDIVLSDDTIRGSDGLPAIPQSAQDAALHVLGLLNGGVVTLEEATVMMKRIQQG